MSDPAASVIIRPMTAADLDSVMVIAASLSDAPHWPRSAYLNALNPGSAPRRIALIAAEFDSTAGFAITSLLPPQAELESIVVVSSSQRRGLGRQLFQEVVSRLKQAAVRELLLEARASNLSALAFYRSLGFAQAGLRRAYYADPVEDAVLMHLQLP